MPLIKNRVQFLFLSLAVGVVLAGSSLVAIADRQEEPEPDSLYKYLSVFTEVLGLVRQTYVEQTDVETLMAGAFEGTADALDAFSVYIPPGEVERYQAVAGTGSSDTGLFLVRDRGWVYVGAVADGSTAEVAGIEAADLLSRIDGASTRDLDVWEIDDQFEKLEGSKVELEIIRRGETLDVTLPLAPLATPAVTEQEVDGVPVLRITRMTADTEVAVRKSLTSLSGDRLLIDVRGISGGDPNVAFAVAQLFADGKLGTLQSQGRVEHEFAASHAPLWHGALAVLGDRGTLGPAEILVNILRQSAGAQFVGEPTYGWAGRSDQVPLSSGGLLVITSAFYAGPDGEVLDSSLAPDMRVTGRDRTLSEKDLTLDELILRRGVQLLLESTIEEKVAA
jgi:carboxyl-terminal processing protease